jgi:hypothetical protein
VKGSVYLPAGDRLEAIHAAITKSDRDRRVKGNGTDLSPRGI